MLVAFFTSYFLRKQLEQCKEPKNAGPDSSCISCTVCTSATHYSMSWERNSSQNIKAGLEKRLQESRNQNFVYYSGHRIPLSYLYLTWLVSSLTVTVIHRTRISRIKSSKASWGNNPRKPLHCTSKISQMGHILLQGDLEVNRCGTKRWYYKRSNFFKKHEWNPLAWKGRRNSMPDNYRMK